MTSGARGKVWRDDAKQWRWTLWKSSDRVSTSGEGYEQKSHALAMFNELHPGVPVEVVEPDEPGAE